MTHARGTPFRYYTPPGPRFAPESMPSSPRSSRRTAGVITAR